LKKPLVVFLLLLFVPIAASGLGRFGVAAGCKPAVIGDASATLAMPSPGREHCASHAAMPRPLAARL